MAAQAQMLTPMRYVFLLFFLVFFLSTPERGFGQAKMSYRELTQDATVKPGAVTIFRKGDHYYLEIQERSFGKDLIWYAELSKGPLVSGAMAGDVSSSSAVNSRIVRLERRENKVFVRDYTLPLNLRAPYLGTDPRIG